VAHAIQKQLKLIMMKNKKWLGEGIIVAIVIAPLVYLMAVWNSLPEAIPMHWNLAGEVDRYGTKQELLWVLGGLQLFTYALLLFLPKIAAKTDSFKTMGSNFYKLPLVTQLLLSSVFFIMLLSSTEAVTTSTTTMLTGLLSLFMLFFGNYMTTIRPNYFMGIRTPWTLENEKVWKKTHLLGGRLWVLGGILGLINLFLLPQSIHFIIIISLMIIPMLIASIYSFILFQKEQKQVA